MKTRYQLKLLGLSLLLSNIGFAVLGADCETAPPQLVAWWRAESNALDQVGTHHGTLRNGATFATGKIGQAFSFDGVNDGISVPDATVLRPLTNLTIEGWIKTPGIAEGAYIGMIAATYRDGGAFFNYGYEFFVSTPSNGGKMGFLINGGDSGAAACYGTNTVTDNVFHHVAATYDGTAMRLYRDGVLNQAIAYAQPIAYAPGQPLWIGRREYPPIPGHFPGLIDELSIYNRALSSGEIAAIYSAGSAGKCAAPKLQISALPGTVRLSWTTNAPGFTLQSADRLSPTNWVNAPSGPTNPATVPATLPAQFYRLRKP